MSTKKSNAFGYDSIIPDFQQKKRVFILKDNKARYVIQYKQNTPHANH